MRLCTLKRSAEFHRIRGGLRWSGPGFLIEGKARPSPVSAPQASQRAQPIAVPPASPAVDIDPRPSSVIAGAVVPQPASPSVRVPELTCLGPRFGFTITRKIGGAVVRNRIRRRLREALRVLDAGLPRSDFDYVIVARKPAAERSFEDLGQDFRAAFTHIHRQPGASARRR